MLRHTCFATGIVLIFLVVPARALATPVYGTPVTPTDFAGSRVYQSEASGDAVIQWSITPSGNSFTYRYTFIFPDVQGPTFKDVSHFTLDLSDDFADSDEQDLRDTFSSNTNDSFDPQDDEDIEFGDKDGLTGAVKFDFGGGKPDGGTPNTSDGQPLFYEFTIDRSPVWGNMAIKAGQNLFDNLGLDNELTSMDTADFIAVPNGIVPEPATAALALLGAGLLALPVALRTRRKT